MTHTGSLSYTVYSRANTVANSSSVNVTHKSGHKPESSVTFLSLKGIKRIVSRDLLKIFEFCKMFWIANNTFHRVN